MTEYLHYGPYDDPLIARMAALVKERERQEDRIREARNMVLMLEKSEAMTIPVSALTKEEFPDGSPHVKIPTSVLLEGARQRLKNLEESPAPNMLARIEAILESVDPMEWLSI